MTKQEVINLIADNVNVFWSGYGEWTVLATITLPRKDNNGDEVINLSYITHNEEDKTGIFGGSRYNTFCGFNSWRELKIRAAEEGLTVAQFQDRVWEDPANDDNYEPTNLRNLRLANRLYEHLKNEDVFDLNIEYQ